MSQREPVPDQSARIRLLARRAGGDIRDLAQMVVDAEAERDRYRKALAFYADEHAYTSTVPHDRGSTARSALGGDDDGA